VKLNCKASATERKEAFWSLSTKRERLYSSTHDHFAFCKTNHQGKGQKVSKIVNQFQISFHKTSNGTCSTKISIVKSPLIISYQV
jgi:hypothetical protein